MRSIELRCAIAHQRISRFRVWSFGLSRKDLRSLHLFAERRAEGMAGIDADDAEFAREEFQLFERKGQRLVVGMAVDIRIELCGEEVAVDHVAFELGHVDAVGGKAAERLVERGW